LVSIELEELSPTERDLEASFRRYSVYTFCVQALYILYLVMLMTSQTQGAYLFILVSCLAFLGTSMDMDERFLYWRATADDVEIKSTHLYLFMISTGCAFLSLLIGTIALTSPPPN
jgi:hypothetical protein